MNQQEKDMIEGLFHRLQQAESQMGKRDAEAETLINGFMTRQTAAPYLLSQVVLVQEQGLKNLQAQVESMQSQLADLERQLAERPQGGGGFLGGLFGGGSQPAAPPRPAQPASRGWGNSPTGAPAMGASPFQQQPGQGGGFLAGAMQTAMGVAGGVLLGNAIAGMFSSPAEAAESPAPAEPAAAPEEPAADEGGGGLFDGFFGGGSDEGGGEEW